MTNVLLERVDDIDRRLRGIERELLTGLLRGSSGLRLGGTALFGLGLAKLFLYDLSALSSVTRAISFLAAGAFMLAGGFFLQKLSARLDGGGRQLSSRA